MDELRDNPYAEYLEAAVEAVMRLQPRAMTVTAILPDNSVMTSYYKSDCTDMAVMAYNIFTDSMMDVVKARIDEVKEALEELEEDDS